MKAATSANSRKPLLKLKRMDRTTVIVVETDPAVAAGYESWWDVAVAEVSETGERPGGASKV